MIPQALKPWLVALMLIACVGYFFKQRAANRRVEFSGPLAELPQQVGTTASSLQKNGYVIEPLADYTVRARVLSIERYRMGREADLSPVDFALGWGAMADDAVLGKLTITQSNRWYQYRWQDTPPIDPALIVRSSANTHLVPADDAIKAQLLAVHPGAVVTLKGHLISVRHNDGWSWRSSLTREDTGGGSCELLWVSDVRVE